MTPDMVKLRMDKKTFDLVLINRVEIRPTCEFDCKITTVLAPINGALD